MQKVKSHLKHKKQSKLVYDVEIIIHKALNLSQKDTEKYIFVKWKRGNHAGETCKVKQHETTATWESIFGKELQIASSTLATSTSSDPSTPKIKHKHKHSKSIAASISETFSPEKEHTNVIHFKTSLYRNGDGSFDEKVVELSLKQEKEISLDGNKKKSTRTLGDITINVSEFAEQIGDEMKKSFPLSKLLTRHDKKNKDSSKESFKLQFTLRMHSNGVVIKNPVFDKQKSLEAIKHSRAEEKEKEKSESSSDYQDRSSSPETVRSGSTKGSKNTTVSLPNPHLVPIVPIPISIMKETSTPKLVKRTKKSKKERSVSGSKLVSGDRSLDKSIDRDPSRTTPTRSFSKSISGSKLINGIRDDSFEQEESMGTSTYSGGSLSDEEALSDEDSVKLTSHSHGTSLLSSKEHSHSLSSSISNNSGNGGSSNSTSNNSSLNSSLNGMSVGSKFDLNSSASSLNSTSTSPRRWNKNPNRDKVTDRTISDISSVKSDEKDKILEYKELETVDLKKKEHIFGGSKDGGIFSPLKNSPQRAHLDLDNFRKGHRRTRSDASAFGHVTGPNPISGPNANFNSGRVFPLKYTSADRVALDRSVDMKKPVDAKENTELNAMSEIIKKQEFELEYLKNQLLEKQQLEDENYVIEKYIVFMEPEYSSHGMPITAYILFRCVLYWKSFDKGRNSQFLDKIFDSLEKLLVKNPRNPGVLLYWLSTTSMLLHLLKKELQMISTDQVNLNSNLTVSQNHREFQKELNQNPFKKFEHRLQFLITGFYHSLLKCLYEQLDPFIVPAILEQPPLGTVTKNSSAPDVEIVISLFSEQLQLMKDNFIFDEIQEQFFKQVLYHINERLFNTLLQRKDLNKCGNAIVIKMALTQLEDWGLNQSVKNLRNITRDQLSSIRNAADLLVMNKAPLSDEKTRREICPALNDKQILHLLKLYSADEYDSEPIHPGVISELVSKENDNDQLLIDGAYSFPLILMTSSISGKKSIQFPNIKIDKKGFEFLVEDTM